MPILVLGGYGLIGSAVLLRLLDAGHAVVALRRDTGSARRRFLEATWIDRDIAALSEPAAWQPLIAGCDAVVNCAGVLQDWTARRRARRPGHRHAGPVPGLRRGRDPTGRAGLHRRRRPGRPDRLPAHQGCGRCRPGASRPRLDDPAPRPRAGPHRLWGNRSAAGRSPPRRSSSPWSMAPGRSRLCMWRMWPRPCASPSRGECRREQPTISSRMRRIP
ncbi:hypothetical protein DA075_31550 [Methylobacterium currus]|uniref:NAD-dependent epimerase/dehydratase domain-containing protein n=1 Tax=Methylobacterium currus TaxID=2051553 RepID=A0A2R4WV67_9HYPH|nr:hypothetical protein DA075_31550 [Methylobacterium currus]